MSDFMFIESRDPTESADVYQRLELASDLATSGHDVTFFLVQNGVFRARAGARFDGLEPVIEAGVTLLADDFSLRERGIATDQLRAGVSASPLETVIDKLSAGSRTLWN